jgi:hypothetical protein
VQRGLTYARTERKYNVSNDKLYRIFTHNTELGWLEREECLQGDPLGSWCDILERENREFRDKCNESGDGNIESNKESTCIFYEAYKVCLILKKIQYKWYMEAFNGKI